MASVYEIKKEICEIGRQIYNKGYVAANDGNISVKVGENEFYCTPTGVSKGYMTPDMIIRIDKDGNKVEGKLNPSSEIKMHMRLDKKPFNIGNGMTFTGLEEEKISGRSMETLILNGDGSMTALYV